MVEEGHAVKVDYTSLPVAIPPDFLVADPPDARPITVQTIDWATTTIPENAGLYATVLDHVLSPSECATLIALAEASVPPSRRRRVPGGSTPWQPALVNIGAGLEVLNTRYRNSDRIVWDSQVVMDRIWARCARGFPGLVEELASVVVVEEEEGEGRRGGGGGGGGGGVARWEFERFNERGRYLRYGSGQYFRRT